MARRPQGTVRKSPRLKQGKPKPPGVGRPSPRPKKKADEFGLRPKKQGTPRKPFMRKSVLDRIKDNLNRKEILVRVKKKAMGGEASEGVAKGALRKRRTTERQRELMDMLNRLYGNKKTMERPIMPKDKPKKKPIRPILPKNFKKPKAKRAN